MSAGTVSARPVALADLFATTRVRNAVLVVGYVLLLAVSARLRVVLPVGPVPITGQTLVVLAGAAALGPTRAVVGSAAFLGLGVAGVPWFAATSGATLGYIVGFVLAAALVGAGARRGHDRGVLGTAGLMVVGNLVIWACGVTGLMLITGASLAGAVTAGVVPFLVGDAIKLALATAILPSAWRLVDAAERR